MVPIIIPKLGLTMESATLLRWAFGSGQAVKKGETVLVIETDKVTYEVPAPEDGILHPIASEGATCLVEQTVGFLAKDPMEYEEILRDHPVLKKEAAEEGEPSAIVQVAPPRPGRIKASPLARSMATAHGLSLSEIPGTGPGGRIVRADILRALEETPSRPRETPAVPLSLTKEPAEKIPIRGVRRIIFDNMFISVSQTAQLTLHTEACAEAIVGLRARLSSEAGQVSYNAILVKMAAMALRAHPRMNVSVEGDTLVVWKQIHIGLAMESNDALIVPVVRSPDQKTLREIDGDIRTLTDKVRKGGLLPDDLSHGTFTITNLGFADIDHFTPILRPPESAILGVGRIQKKPVVRGEEIVSEARMGLSLTFDHRVIDGAPAARFLKTIKDMMEDPLLMIW